MNKTRALICKSFLKVEELVHWIDFIEIMHYKWGMEELRAALRWCYSSASLIFTSLTLSFKAYNTGFIAGHEAEAAGKRTQAAGRTEWRCQKTNKEQKRHGSNLILCSRFYWMDSERIKQCKKWRKLDWAVNSATVIKVSSQSHTFIQKVAVLFSCSSIFTYFSCLSGASTVAFCLTARNFRVAGGPPFRMDHLFNIIALNLTISISHESAYARCCALHRH